MTKISQIKCFNFIVTPFRWIKAAWLNPFPNTLNIILDHSTVNHRCHMSHDLFHIGVIISLSHDSIAMLPFYMKMGIVLFRNFKSLKIASHPHVSIIVLYIWLVMVSYWWSGFYFKDCLKFNKCVIHFLSHTSQDQHGVSHLSILLFESEPLW